MVNNKLLAKQVAERLRISTVAVYQYVYEGRLKAVKWGTQWVFDIADVEEFEANRRLKSGRPVTRKAS